MSLFYRRNKCPQKKLLLAADDENLNCFLKLKTRDVPLWFPKTHPPLLPSRIKAPYFILFIRWI